MMPVLLSQLSSASPSDIRLLSTDGAGPGRRVHDRRTRCPHRHDRTHGAFLRNRGAAAAADAPRPGRLLRARGTGCAWTWSARCRNTATPSPRSNGCWRASRSTPTRPSTRSRPRCSRRGCRTRPSSSTAPGWSAGRAPASPTRRSSYMVADGRARAGPATAVPRARRPCSGHAVELIKLPVPTDVLHDSARDHRRARHRGRRGADRGVRRRAIWGPYRAANSTTSRSSRCSTRLRPLAVQGLVSAFGRAADRAARRGLSRDRGNRPPVGQVTPRSPAGLRGGACRAW